MAGLLARLLRRPGKYIDPAFWRIALSEGAFRGRAACLYLLPAYLRTLGRTRRTVLVYPSRMDRYQFAETYVAWKVFAACDLKVSDRFDSRTALAIAWNPSTEYHLSKDAFEAVPKGLRVLNAHCTDIRKSTIGRIHHRIFGYALEVDPLTYEGSIVRKSERNGAHDGVILQGPLAQIDPGCVYQRLVACVTPNGLTEWRVFIVGRRAVDVYELIGDPAGRFAPNKTPCFTTIEQAFSPEEQRNIAAFCEATGLDFGVLDVLRDGPAGRIYVTDCNNSPTGPAKKMPLVQQVRFVRNLARHFRDAYLDNGA